jgi:lipopolysaccharide export system protein LptA
VMTGKMFPGAHRMQTVMAEQDVVIRATGPHDERVGRGDLAIYSAEREEVELTGKDGVDIRIRDAAGESRARGKKIVYTRRQDLAVLSGDPVITSPKGEVTGDTVVFDRANSTLQATGNWKMKLRAESLKPATLPAGLPAPKRKPVRTGVKANSDS